MDKITIEHNPSQERLEELQVSQWPVWTKEASVFPWYYDKAETCYFLEGEVLVTPEGGDPVAMGQGDLVTFAEGLSCTWDIRSPVKKHYFIG